MLCATCKWRNRCPLIKKAMSNRRIACEYYTKSYPTIFRERILKPIGKFIDKRFRRYNLRSGLNYVNFLRKNFECMKNSIELYNNNKKLRRYKKVKT